MNLSWLRAPVATPIHASSLALALSISSLVLTPASAATDLAIESIPSDAPLDNPVDVQNSLGDVYEPEFAAFDRSLIGRAPVPEGVRNLRNNEPEVFQVDVGATYCYVLEKDTMSRKNPSTREVDENGEEILSRQADDDGINIMLSATTCVQPFPNKADQKEKIPPQLTLFYVDTTYEDCMKGADKAPVGQSRTFNEGIVQQSLFLEKDVYVGISAPNATDFHDVYNFEVAASKDYWYHSFDEDGGSNAELLWMDSDSSAALLQTQNLTETDSEAKEIMDEGPIYELFVQNDAYKVFGGISRSVCGMRGQALIHATKNGDGRLASLVNTTLTTQGPGGFPKQQFYFEGLNSSSAYSGVLFRTKADSTAFDISQEEEGSTGVGAGKIGGGGTVYELLNFRTSAGQSCKVITDLEFCNINQYAVPGRPDMDGVELAKKYDDYAKGMYANFEKVMAQIQCETDPTSKYSLARNCDECRTAYKRWLCTVSFPRCEDMSSNNTHAVIRNIGMPYPNGTMVPEDALKLPIWKPWHNASRNAFIDSEINPGPYKEILPCEDICYEVVQACHAAIGFTCPRPKSAGFQGSYGRREDGSTELTCNYPGEPKTKISAAMAIVPRLLLPILPLAFAMMF